MTAKDCKRVYTKELLQQRNYTLDAHVSSGTGLLLRALSQPVLKHAAPALQSLQRQTDEKEKAAVI